MSTVREVTVSGDGQGRWAVSHGRALPLTFDGAGAEGRARKYAADVRAQVEAGTFDPKAARGRCKLGEACDRDAVNVPLRELTDEQLARVVLCDAHRGEARPGRAGSGRPAGASSAPGGSPDQAGDVKPAKGAGRRRKAAPS